MRFLTLLLSLLTFGSAFATPENISARKQFSRATDAPNGVVYAILENPTRTDYRLLGAHSPHAAFCELHETIEEDGVAKMRPRPEGFTLPAHGRIHLKPGGAHIMLMRLKHPLIEGDHIEITLVFDNNKKIDLNVPVRAAGAICCGCDSDDGLCKG